jgi:hypothetical protein
MKETVLKHVDTLYLYYKCTVSTYLEALRTGGFDEAQMIGYSKGYDWYDFEIARIGVMDYDKAVSANTYAIVIQYNAVYLMQTNLKDLKLFFDQDLEKYIIKRIDYAYTFNIKKENFDYINDIVVSPYFRKQSVIIGSDRNIETLYLGLRRTGKVFRLYNKSKELNDKNNHEKSQILNHHFGTLDNLFVYEIELHRKYLRDRCGVNSLADLEKVNKIVYTLFTSLKFCKNTEQNRQNMKNKHYDRIDFEMPFCNIMNNDLFDFLPVKKYQKSKDFLISSLRTIIKQYNSKEGHTISNEEVMTALEQLENENRIIELEITYDEYD